MIAARILFCHEPFARHGAIHHSGTYHQQLIRPVKDGQYSLYASAAIRQRP